jgi:hypothetical protein
MSICSIESLPYCGATDSFKALFYIATFQKLVDGVKNHRSPASLPGLILSGFTLSKAAVTGMGILFFFACGRRI